METCKSIQYFLGYSGFKSRPSFSMTLYFSPVPPSRLYKPAQNESHKGKLSENVSITAVKSTKGKQSVCPLCFSPWPQYSRVLGEQPFSLFRYLQSLPNWILRPTNMTKQIVATSCRDMLFWPAVFHTASWDLWYIKWNSRQISLRVLERFPCRYHSTSAPHSYLFIYHQRNKTLPNNVMVK